MVALAESSRNERRARTSPRAGSPSFKRRQEPTTRFHCNQQYSITALTDGTGGIVERYAYTAYGQPTFADGSGTVLTASAEDNRYTYTGREWDEILGLYHYRARMYDATEGRFISRDPIGFVDGASLYRAYFSLGKVDPTGTKREGGVYPLSNSHSLAGEVIPDQIYCLSGDAVAEVAIYDVVGFTASAGMEAKVCTCPCGDTDAFSASATIYVSAETGFGVGLNLKFFGLNFGAVAKGPQIGFTGIIATVEKECDKPLTVRFLALDEYADVAVSGSTGDGIGLSGRIGVKYSAGVTGFGISRHGFSSSVYIRATASMKGVVHLGIMAVGVERQFFSTEARLDMRHDF